jgi:hypothetical protein
MILNRFPKERPELPAAYRQIYLEHIMSNRAGSTNVTSLSSRMEGWLHRAAAADVRDSEVGNRERTTLEIGAGTLNHLAYEPAVSPYDIVEPCKELYQGSRWLRRIRTVYPDITEVDETRCYDRIISIATFEHIVNLPEVAAAAALRLRPEGCLRVGIPNEGTILWRLGTRVTGYEFRQRYGLDYRVLMAFEHVNTAREIEAVLRCFFRNIKCRVFGLSRGLAFYRFYVCRAADRDSAKHYLARGKE